MVELLEAISNNVIPHWAFFAMAFLTATIGQFTKKYFFTTWRAERSRFFWWCRATLPLHPVIAAGLISAVVELFAEMPSAPHVDKPVARILYYMMAGAFSSWGYDLFVHFMRSRGVEQARQSQDPKYPKDN